jgi:hypothetical protein
MWDHLLHLWATPPPPSRCCPPGAPGQTTNPAGIFDERTVRAAYGLVSAESFLVVLAFVLGCYLLTRATTGPRFTRQWAACWALAAVSRAW